MVQGVGQSCNQDTVCNTIERFHLDNVREIVVHVAVDVEKDGYGLFWKLSPLKAKVRGALFASYFPLMLQGAGNFYFSIPGEETEGRPKIRMEKYYNKSFKNVHRSKNPAFT